VSVEVDPALLRGEGTLASEWLGAVENPHAYRLVRKLGAGGMAEVVLATCTNADGNPRSVAIKLVREDFAAYREFREMFTAEAKLASRLTHPNIVEVLDYACDAEKRPFLVMEYVAGVDLWTALRHPRPLSVSVAAFVATEVLRGLGYAHALPGSQEIRGVVHRDLSPQNILLSWDGAVKISDFGIARALVRSSVSGTVSGKPAYMSPEQTRGDRLDGRSDLYSAGVVLWEMLTGQRLFGRGRIQEIFAEIALGAVPAPSLLRSEVPEALDRVVGKLLAVDRDERYRGAEDALADLVACQGSSIEGARELSEALAERFHRPPRGSDGISVVAEDRATFDTTGITPTVRTETEEGDEPFARERAASRSGGEEAPIKGPLTIGGAPAASRPHPPRLRFDLVAGAAAALLLLVAWFPPLADDRAAPSPAPSSASPSPPSGLGAPPEAGAAVPSQAPQPFATAPSPAREASAAPPSFPAGSPPRSAPAARPQREPVPVRRRPPASRSVAPEPAAREASGIIDLHLEESGS
jgi:eukaryotic-like serine/threonine-protein kinase